MSYQVEINSTTIQEPVPDENLVTEDYNEVEEPKPTAHELIERYASIQGISYEEAELQIGAPTEEEILKKIQDKTIEKINNTRIPMNRAQRRALKKKVGAKKYVEMVADSGDAVTAVSETAKKLNYIHLIEKLKKINEEKEKNGTDDDEEN